jgi:ribonuclease P protein component
VLPAAARMRRRQEFELAVRRGKRASGRLLTVHLLVPAGAAPEEARDEALGEAAEESAGESARADPAASPRIGFVITRAVGRAVVRNRVRRRLREVARVRTGRLPAGSLLVIRANPRAADARQRDLAAELDLVLGRLLRRQVRA